MKNSEMATLIREQGETIRSMGMRIDDLSSKLGEIEPRFQKAQRVYAALMTRVLTKEGKDAYKELVAQFKKDSF